LEGTITPLVSLLSPSGFRSKLLILMYHRVLRRKDPFIPDAPDAQTFENHLRILKERFFPLHLRDAAGLLQAGQLPAGAVCVTFDDGYRDNFETALPLLQKWGVPATFFISVGYLGNGRMWNDSLIEAIRAARTEQLNLSKIGLGDFDLSTQKSRLTAISQLIDTLKYLPMDERLSRVAQISERVGEALPEDLMMTPDQVRALPAAGVSIGAHTVSHPILARIPDEEASREIREGRTYLESLAGEKVRLFAYPNGKPGRDYDDRHVRMVRQAGFEAAVSAAWGVNRRASDIFQLARIAPWESSSLGFATRMLKTYL